MQAWCKVCYLWICIVCVVARMGPGVQRTKKIRHPGHSCFIASRIRRICLEGRSVTLTPMASFSRAAPMGAQR